ncbi:hypothetical protein TREMEDRAFT_66334 [Tremella mesenterica DSM 1558]|uniref:uncharacterized protein n=1 Tax=Tremella mesenterica (strain ATCC 24925 / CBS 8224 / DSM 1558 / NBRC 9311 / NRRL Y-6157 / RJB 2259-6 / UBC 559-6) TaxID=578456 RepID=UPI00032D5EA6|nr:uncharacterized protein TREMEDRAFT_66334 [Tremella mesenterica DSM 1558]EIW65611.1 hypothetical protein TREMEDRAFT_66334 [Tremella mesenterica DSM 1558]
MGSVKEVGYFWKEWHIRVANGANGYEAANSLLTTYFSLIQYHDRLEQDTSFVLSAFYQQFDRISCEVTGMSHGEELIPELAAVVAWMAETAFQSLELEIRLESARQERETMFSRLHSVLNSVFLSSHLDTQMDSLTCTPTRITAKAYQVLKSKAKEAERTREVATQLWEGLDDWREVKVSELLARARSTLLARVMDNLELTSDHSPLYSSTANQDFGHTAFYSKYIFR